MSFLVNDHDSGYQHDPDLAKIEVYSMKSLRSQNDDDTGLVAGNSYYDLTTCSFLEGNQFSVKRVHDTVSTLGLTLYRPMTHNIICVMAPISHKNLYGGLILGVKYLVQAFLLL